MSRKTICLNGECDFMPVYGVKNCVELPKELKFEETKIRVPSSWWNASCDLEKNNKKRFGVVDDFQPFNLFEYPDKWSEAETGVYRRTFLFTGNVKCERVFLRFDGMSQISKIYLNGFPIAEWTEAYLPLKVEVTDYIKEDNEENELLVVCSTFEKVQIASGEQKSLGLIGSWFGVVGRGIWQDVYLETCPQIYIEDIFVKTSVRNKEVSTTITLSSKAQTQKELEIRARVLDKENVAIEFNKTKSIISSDEKQVLQVAEYWQDTRIWTLDDPYLYDLEVSIYENNELIDLKTIKFGFREVWYEGHKFYLNGVRVNLRGDSWHFQGAIQQTKEYALNWFKMCKENGLNFVRLHAEPHPEYYLDAADEVGILIVDETAIYGSSKTMAADHPTFIENCKKHAERLVMRDRNHPSVVLWSLQNEMRWVDGRDEYKLHIPEMINIIKDLDKTRPVYLEGDNRLLAKEKSDIESYHYNIDGTISQWDKKRPLIFGEHGGWWYVSPQNSSNYSGLDAYLDSDNAVKGLALREKYYVEYCRRSEVTGITSFNFAHYMMKSMPEEDIALEWENLDTPRCKPKFIRKHSLTINNGLLKNYPMYKNNVAMDVLRESYRPVTIIPVEYDSSFFDQREITRTFDVYNDTLQGENCKVQFHISLNREEVLFDKTYEYFQDAGERKEVCISFKTPQITTSSEIILKAKILHEEREMFEFVQVYKIYPSAIKLLPLECSITTEKRTAYYGNENDFNIIKMLLPKCERITKLNDLKDKSFELFVIGSYTSLKSINSREQTANEIIGEAYYQQVLGDFVEKGGYVVVLEQLDFSLGNLSLVKQSFFSTHINDSSHNVVKGLTNEDLIFWKPYILEDKPQDIIKQSFIKPVEGNVNIILESSAGDFGDGGDLWTPLVEYKFGKGGILFNQLELMDNFLEVPQAAILLRNIMEHAYLNIPEVGLKTVLIAKKDGNSDKLFTKLLLKYEQKENVEELKNHEVMDTYKIVIVDPDLINEKNIKSLSEFVENGGVLLILPANNEKVEVLSKIAGASIDIFEKPTFQLIRTSDEKITQGMSIVDLFRFEKVICSPRMVKNVEIAINSISVEGGETLLESVEGTPWHDYYVRNYIEEFSIIALADKNRKYKKKSHPYLSRIKKGKGCIIFSSISIDSSFEKNVRIYGRLISNLGGEIGNNLFTYIKGHNDFSADYLMTLPHHLYKNFDAEMKYYTDKEYSLNNLGEGLYGWMQKIEKDSIDGFINIPNSKDNIYFMTCFPVLLEENTNENNTQNSLMTTIEIDVNCKLDIYINGSLIKKVDEDFIGSKRIKTQEAELFRGLNRMVLVCYGGAEDIKIRPVFMNLDGSYVSTIKYQLTIDEVDPK